MNQIDQNFWDFALLNPIRRISRTGFYLTFTSNSFFNPKGNNFHFFNAASLLGSHMVEIFSPWRADIASAVVQKWPCVLRPYNLRCTMFTLTSFRTNKFVFTVLSYWSYLIAEEDYEILLMMPSWERTETHVEIKPSSVLAGGFHNFDRHLSFLVQKLLRCHPLWCCTYEFKGGKQILIAHRSGPTIRFWRGCEMASWSDALLFVWKQSWLCS